MAARSGRSVALAPSVQWSGRLEAGAVLCTVLLLGVAFVVLCPLALLLVNSFEVTLPDGTPAYSVANWVAAFREPGLAGALVNTLTVTAAAQGISMPLAVGIAWLLARTDMPGGRPLELLLWISFFLPTLVLTSGWILVAEPHYGLLNQALMQTGLFKGAPFDIYSFWGIVFVHVTGVGLGAKVMLLVPSFRNMDASLEEASTMSGAGTLRTLVRLVVPVMAPAVIVVALASLIRAFQAFEIELVLGTPIRFSVYSTKVYGLINQSPVNYGAATALSMLVLLAMLPLVLLQLRLSGRRSYATVSGRFRAQRTRLGRWRWPAVVLVAGVALLGTVVPVCLMVMGSFMQLFGYLDTAQVWSVGHWAAALADPNFSRALVNTLALGLGTAAAATTVYTLIAYVTVRTRFRARWAFDVLSWVPFTIPGIVLGLGYLLFVLETPALRAVYGSMLALIVVSTMAVMTLSIQLLKTNMLQLTKDLEESARSLGGSWWQTFRTVVAPLLAPALATTAIMTFALSAREVAEIIPLTSGRTETLAVLQLTYLLAEDQSSAAAVGTVTVLLTVGAALAARAIGSRRGLAAGLERA
ncbi:MAG: iron ABC transporter permease [Chloroflexi bacterium]|nr:iron ABC transporter permease [Chloroflexota bacterium]